uniref:ZIP family metal transporter n=1 Tax=candidate division WWE3 bacterium TaxID=2053526 RepID=A0A7C4TJ21_UNCKA
MSQNLTQAILASLAVSAITLPLGLIFLKSTKTRKWLGKHFISLCAGVMLGNALTNLLPEAIELTSNTKLVSLSILVGILAFFLLEKSKVWFHHHDGNHGHNPTVQLVIIGDNLHNFIDGIAIALAFMASTHLGIITTIAIILHEIPTELSDLSLLINRGMKIKKAMLYNFYSALASLLGTVLGFYFLANQLTFQAAVLGGLAGMFIYIACSDLIPDMHNETNKEKNLISIAIFIVGIGITYFTS